MREAIQADQTQADDLVEKVDERIWKSPTADGTSRRK
jgi:hypothetical protein